MNELRGLSVRQPWAWGICAGLKRTENRTWSTDRRGTIAIHASTSSQVVNAIRKETGCDAMHRDSFTFGAIIGLAELVDVASYGPQHEDDPFAEGPYCWSMANGRFLKEPIPLKGKLNLFKIPTTIQEQLKLADTFSVDLNGEDCHEIADAMMAQPDPITSYLELIDEFWQTSQHIDAVRVAAERLMELAPDESSAYVVHAALRLSDDEADDCSKCLLHALELNSGDEFAKLFLPEAYLKEERYHEAVEAADELIQLDPSLATGFAARAHAYFFLGEIKKSLADWDRAIDLMPDDAVNWAFRGEAKAAQGDKEGAVADVAEAIRLDPDNPTVTDVQERLLERL